MDLATGVLLLWYGGLVVMQADGQLSVGKLITFQLYWYAFREILGFHDALGAVAPSISSFVILLNLGT
jgi:hypothetical protein